jgi:RES domain
MASVPDGHSAPPAELPGAPQIEPVRAGTALWRVHAGAYAATQFKPVAPRSSYEGGRFDALADGDPYLYAGDSPECAIAEVWDRDIGPGAEQRFIPEASLQGRVLSQLRLKTDLLVIDVSVPAASQFGQTAWLTTCDAHEYPHTRQWAAWLRQKGPPHAGFVWRSRRDLGRHSYVFYEHQLPSPAVFEPVDSVAVEHGAGRARVEATMLVHNAVFRSKAP